MKIVKKSFTLRADEFEFAVKQAAKAAKESGSPINVSAYIRRLLALEKSRIELKQAA